jgi:hypothetical protein
MIASEILKSNIPPELQKYHPTFGLNSSRVNGSQIDQSTRNCKIQAAILTTQKKREPNSK